MSHNYYPIISDPEQMITTDLQAGLEAYNKADEVNLNPATIMSNGHHNYRWIRRLTPYIWREK